ncbi:MAG: hypothetical protein CVU78_00370 [Elusimicrobia bacterium HGW-Elusimicrobia-2]|nr:MAG: hypothetical protein CVU78_00370 [Elusimicrobia bacterium HGW-Elusimicrobia-2]
MKKFLVMVLLSGLMAAQSFAAMGGAGASSAWGDKRVQKKISIQQGTSVGAYVDRGDILMASTMTAVGDGTYYIKVENLLCPGAVYNYQFMAVSTSAPTGLTSGTTYYDPVPSSGSDAAFVVSASSGGAGQPALSNISGAGYYGGTGDGGRRILSIPYDVSQLWVYNNWGSTPSVASVQASPTGADSVTVSWVQTDPWTGGISKPIDVIMGGKYFVYQSTGLASVYEFSTSTHGYSTSISTQGLITGSTYYFVVVSSDAYAGLTNTPNTPDGNLATYAYSTVISTTAGGTDVPYSASARPSAAIPVYFKVEKPNWDYIEANGYLVYLTPVGEDGRYFRNKIQGKITRVCMPRT